MRLPFTIKLLHIDHDFFFRWTNLGLLLKIEVSALNFSPLDPGHFWIPYCMGVLGPVF
jgi:hypothetical protein